MQVNYRSVFRISGFTICCIASLILLQLNTGCSEKKETTGGTATQQDSAASGELSAAAATGVIDGKVIETMDAGRYTYVLIQTSEEAIWAAGPVTEIKIGEKLSLQTGMLMKDFNSKTLDRTFETIYFVQSFNKKDVGSIDPHEAMRRAHGNSDVSIESMDSESGGRGDSSTGGKPELDQKVVGEIEKAPDGHTVAEIFALKADLASQTVIVRGVVVKFTPSIMGTNWLHLQDGTGAEGSHDLTVTTNATVNIGDVVMIRGVLKVDKDFGAGYSYDVIIEQGELITD